MPLPATVNHRLITPASTTATPNTINMRWILGDVAFLARPRSSDAPAGVACTRSRVRVALAAERQPVGREAVAARNRDRAYNADRRHRGADRQRR
jgi:hypothetical protein